MTFDDAARARIAMGWLNSSLDQPAYAAQHGISTRTLRSWVERYGPGDRPAARARAIISSAIAHLQALQAALDAEVAADSASAVESTVQLNPERHAGSEALVTPPGVARVSPETLPAPSSTSGGERTPGAHGAEPARDIEATGDVPEVAHTGVAVPDIAALVDGGGPAASRASPAGRNDRDPSQGNAPTNVLDIEALRQRVAQRRAARAAGGAPKRNPFLEWDSE